MDWPSIEWDDGYPTDESIEALEKFWEAAKIDFRRGAQFLLEELPACAANCCAYCEVSQAKAEYDEDETVTRIDFSTSGWSGAEQIIGLVEKRIDVRHHMFSWRRGGHYVFEIIPFFINDIEKGGE